MTQATNLQKILSDIRNTAYSERDKGYRFERLMLNYFKTNPKYAYDIKDIWLWNDFFARKDFGGSDLGIDLVAITENGDYWAIQCKCYDPNTSIDKASVDSFLSTSSKVFKGENLEEQRFSQRFFVSTTNKWSSNAEKTIESQDIEVLRINLSELENAPVDWAKLAQNTNGIQARLSQKELRPHQTKAVEAAKVHFETQDRGKLIMACGTGKTFTSLRIAENQTDNKGLILFLVPSIALLGQTLREWTAEAKLPIAVLCVCSDAEVSKQKTKNDDNNDFSLIDLAMPASTKHHTIVKNWYNAKAQLKKGMTVIFSTYQSIDVLAKAQETIINKQNNDNQYGIFDLIICDEAHRTTGVTLSNEDDSAFVKVHNNDFLKARKRIYMTATPRLYNAESKEKAAKYDAELCSMDDTALYGNEIYRIGFGEAVEKGLLADYKVFFSYKVSF